MTIIIVILWLCFIVSFFAIIFGIRHAIQEGYSFSDMFMGFVIQMVFPAAYLLWGLFRFVSKEDTSAITFGMFLLFGVEACIGSLIGGSILTFVVRVIH